MLRWSCCERCRMASVRKVIIAPEFASYPKDWHFSPAIDTGGFVFFSGITGVRPDKTLANNPSEQFRDTFRFAEMHLQAAGVGFEHIVDLTTYHVDLRKHLAEFVAVKDEFIKEPFPTWTAVGVSELITPGTLLEVRIVAIRD
jgi:enamine deaminase RidA (YjgF/YER057c/UK114 family)